VTATRIRQYPAIAHHAKPRPGRPIVAAAIIGGVALLIRLALHVGGFDLYGDEVLYMDLGRSVISGGFPNYQGQIFFLHGPGFFYLEAGWAHLVGNQNGVMAWVYEMRALNALLAGGTAAALVLLTARASSLRAGIVAGLLFALDPFCIRQNDRVLLETAMMFWVLLGYLVFVSLIRPLPSRHDRLRAIGAGVLFGCAVLTKDEGALLTVVPLLAALVLRWGPRRTLTSLTIGTAVAVYGAYVAVVAVNGKFRELWEAKTFGIQRMIGLIQITGFHSKGGGNLSARLTGEVAVFWTTYAILVLAMPALVVILRRGGQLQRILGLLYFMAGVTLGYAVVLGTLEEQELYLLVVPSLLIVSVAATLIRHARQTGKRSTARGFSKVARVGIVISALVLAFGFNIATCVRFLRQPDDAFIQMFRYITVHVPPGTSIGAIDGDIDSGYSLSPRYNVGYWTTSAALSQDQVRYVVVEWGPVDQGYSDLTSSQVRQLVAPDQLVVSFWGRTNGQVALYKLPLPRSSSRSRVRREK
jgi:4-amino-4-deoxy-L-arabinose transferase-like glycosyltransferase